jgi:GT2 family glycosyltransferase
MRTKIHYLPKIIWLFILKPYVLLKFLKQIKNYRLAVNYLKTEMYIYYRRYTYNNQFDETTIEKTLNSIPYQPLISIVVPVYNVNPVILDKALKSVYNQFYKYWEIILVDDGSTNQDTLNYLRGVVEHRQIKVEYMEQNSGISIATNRAIKSAQGEFIAFMDNDDELTYDALYEVVKAINFTKADFIYSDEDFISLDGRYINPHFKPDFSPDLLLSHNYITHFVVVKSTLIDKVGGLRSQYDGAQDHEFVLRATHKADKVVHIPKVLYHWRMSETSTAFDSTIKPKALSNAQKALQDTLTSRGIKAHVEAANLPFFFKVNYLLLSQPLISIIIPFKDKVELLKKCVESILDKSTYQNFEIIGMSNNSKEQKTFDEMKRLSQIDKRINFYEYNLPFNYSQINNYAVNHYAKGEHILLLNNDIEIISSSWIEEMLMFSQREDVGCVGAKLYYSNGKVQHAGVILGLGGYAAHSHRMHSRESNGYFNRLNIVQNLSAITGACLMVKKSIYQELDGLDEKNFVIAYNDVDFCLRVLKKGYLNIFTPFAEAYHYESLSRGNDSQTQEKRERFNREKAYLLEYHRDFIDNDPYYNPNLTRDNENFDIK